MERRRPTGRRVLKRTQEPETDVQKLSSRRTAIIITAIFFFVITISIVIGLYFSVWKDLWRPVITINDETINMSYLIRRMKYVDKTDDVWTMLYEIIPHEMLIRQGAPRYGIEATPEEVDDVLRDIAQGENETISEYEFKSWYRNELNKTKLSGAEYREWARTNILSYRLNEYLVERIPTVAEQIHLYIIILPSYEEAESAITRIQEGEGFSELAQELSIDTETGEQGGDAGWWPAGGGLEANLEWAAFNYLETGEINEVPLLIDDNTGIYAVFMVTEKQPAREIEEDKMQVIKSGILEEWLYNERLNSTVIFSGMDWSEKEQRYVFGSMTLAWVELQLTK
jgi:hypothetical protein